MTESRLQKSKLSGKSLSKQGLGAAPSIVLLNPQMGENIGASARGMLNFGMTSLRIVNPRDGWPNERAGALAAGASTVVDAARVFDDTQSALADFDFVLATTARPRDIMIPVFDIRDAITEIKTRMANGQKCAITFGGEQSGMTTEDIARANGILTIPVNPNFSSLNLAQAVMCVAYEWGQQLNDEVLVEQESTASFDSKIEAAKPAQKQDLYGLFDHLEAELDKAGFFYPEEKRPGMQRSIRTALTRAEFTHQEVQTMRGIVSALSKERQRKNK